MKVEKPKAKRRRIWAIDFDGTLCKSAYPKIGEPNWELIEVLKLCGQLGVCLILWTNRTGEKLDEAVQWCQEKGLSFTCINTNAPEIVEAFGDDPRKIYADLYIDDRAFPYWGTGKKGEVCELLEKV